MDEFNRMVLDLKSLVLRINDEHQAITLTSTLPSRYEYFVDAMLFGKNVLAMSEIKAALNSKEIKKKVKHNQDSAIKWLIVR